MKPTDRRPWLAAGVATALTGTITAGYPSDATENAVQASIVTAAYQ